MIRFMLLAVLAAGLATGCGKKAAKHNGQPDSSPPPDQTPTPAPVAKSGSGGGPAPAPTPAPSNPGTGGPAVVPSAGAGGGVVLNPGAALGGGGGGGAAQAIRKAAKRAATQNELNQIRLFIENASAVDGRIPDPKFTLAALQREAPKIAEAVKDGVIVLHPARTRDEIWAYEAVALEQGGQVVSSSGIERMDVPTLKGRLGLR